TFGVGTLLTGTTSFAEDNVSIVDPYSELYDTSLLVEEVQVDLTEDITEKALLQDQFADERIEEVEIVLENGDEEKAENILEQLDETVQEVDELLEESVELEDGDQEIVEEVIAEKTKKRTEKLTALLEREDLPETAKAGIAKAL